MTKLLTRILTIPFSFSKVFKILNDKQTTHELNMSIFSSWRWNRSLNVSIVALITQNTKLSSFICFQLSRWVFQGLSASTIRSQRKCLFLLTLSTMSWLFFLHMRNDYDGGKQSLRWMPCYQQNYWIKPLYLECKQQHYFYRVPLIIRT